jgi:hypothetical protein
MTRRRGGQIGHLNQLYIKHQVDLAEFRMIRSPVRHLGA